MGNSNVNIIHIMNLTKIECFHGGITRMLLECGFDSRKVLNAVNSWVGEQNVEDRGSKQTAKLSGTVLKSGEDRRKIVIDQTVKRRAASKVTPQGTLYAFSEEVGKVADKYGVALMPCEFPPIVNDWLSAKAESFKLAPKAEATAPVEA